MIVQHDEKWYKSKKMVKSASIMITTPVSPAH